MGSNCGDDLSTCGGKVANIYPSLDSVMVGALCTGLPYYTWKLFSEFRSFDGTAWSIWLRKVHGGDGRLTLKNQKTKKEKNKKQKRGCSLQII